MRITADLPESNNLLQAVLDGFVSAAAMEVAAGVVPPFPDASGVRFVKEGAEHWKLPHQTIRDRQGDCEDLAIWEAGGWRATGQDPGARVVLVRTGARQLHAVVQLSSGELSDPSARLKQQERVAMSLGGVVIKDHRHRRPGPLSPGAAAPPAAPPSAPRAPTAFETANAALRDYMAKKGTKYLNLSNAPGARLSQYADLYALADQVSNAAAQRYQDDQYRGAREAAAQYAQERGVVVDAKTFGVPRRTDVAPNPEDFEFVQDDAGNAYWKRMRADQLAEVPQFPGSPWGGGYGSDYGYGGDFGFGFDYYGFDEGAYGWQYGSGPLTQYEDLYESFEMDDGSADVQPELEATTDDGEHEEYGDE